MSTRVVLVQKNILGESLQDFLSKPDVISLFLLSFFLFLLLTSTNLILQNLHVHFPWRKPRPNSPGVTPLTERAITQIAAESPMVRRCIVLATVPTN